MSSKSHPHRENTLLYALNKWESLHAQVSTLLGEYLISCNTLEAFLRPPLRSSPNELDQVFTAIDAVLAMLDQTNAQIQKSSRILARVRNRSATRVPISTLPDEILVYVLSLAKLLCVIDCEPSISKPPLLNSLLCVSMHWYSLLTRTPWIWSHIDLTANKGDLIDKNHLVDAQHSLQRAGKTRLHVHIQTGRKPKDQALGQIIRLLIPHVNDITSLQIWFDSSSPVGQIFDSLFGHDYWGSLQEIFLNGDDPPPVYIPDALLQSLQVVNIRGASLSWNSRILSGLTEIHVDAGCKASRLNISNIFTVLTGCPELRSLALIGIGSQVDFIRIGTVHLSQLEFLDLRGMGPGLLPLFLSWLYPGQKKLGFSIDIISDNVDTCLQEISNFMKRTMITRFCASFNPDLDQLPLDILVSFISGNLPYLEVLALEDYDFGRKRIENNCNR